MNLNIIFEKFELYYDVLDCNIIHFFIKNGYFFISSSLYLDEDDPYLELPEFEMDDQANSKQGGLKKIIFENNKINIEFLENEKFMEKYSVIIIHFNYIDKTIADFFNNYLFLGKYIEYADSFNKENIIIQTEEREYL